MRNKLLPVADAFRYLIQSNAPERDDLLQINSYRWFHGRLVRDGKGEPARRLDDKPAYEALELLETQKAGGELHLRGTLGDALPADIDPIDVRQGHLDVFAGTLKIYAGKDTYRTSRIYNNVYCYVVEETPLKGKGGRPPKFDRAAVAAEVARLMDHHGEFSPDDPEWNAQARLTEAIIAKFGEAALSTVDEYIKQPLTEWRERRHPKT